MNNTTTEYIDEVTLNIEGNNEDGFFSIYAGLRMLKDYESKWQISENESKPDGEKVFSIIGAEAYCRLEELKENYPDLTKYSELRYEELYSKR